MPTIPTHFRDANHTLVEYDGSEIAIRISIYGVVIKNDSLLVIKSNQEKFYDIPGGGVDFGEDLAQALIREGREEAGVELEPIKPLWETMDWFYYNDEKKFYRTIQLYWLANIVGEIGKPTDPRYGIARWVPLAKLNTLGLYPKILEVLRKSDDIALHESTSATLKTEI